MVWYCFGTAFTILPRMSVMCKQFFCTTGGFGFWACCGQFVGVCGLVVGRVVGYENVP
jgi:hypothetical protein